MLLFLLALVANGCDSDPGYIKEQSLESIMEWYDLAQLQLDLPPNAIHFSQAHSASLLSLLGI